MEYNEMLQMVDQYLAEGSADPKWEQAMLTFRELLLEKRAGEVFLPGNRAKMVEK